MINLIKNHWPAFVLAFFIGAFMVAPAFYWKYVDDDGGQGLSWFKNDAETHYVGQIQEVYDGHIRGSNFATKGLKDLPYLWPPLSGNIIAFFGKVFFLDAVQVAQVFKFIAGFLLSLLLYFLVFALSKRRWTALVVSAFVFLASNLVNPRHILELFGLLPFAQEGQFLIFSRTIQPQMASLFFFGYLLAFWYFLQNDKHKYLLGFLCVIILGFSFYINSFTWSFLYCLNGILFLLYLFKKDYLKVKKILLVTGFSLFLSIPYFLNLINAIQHSWYEESFVRFGFFESRALVLSRLMIGVFVLFLIFRKNIFKESRIFIFSLLLTGFAVVNQQLVTGTFFANERYHWYYNTPIAIIVLVIVLFSFLEKRRINKKWLSVFSLFLILLFFWSGFVTQKISYSKQRAEAIEEQRYVPVIEWLNNNTLKDDSVFGAIRLMGIIPAFTHNNVYFNGTCVYDLFPNERAFHAYYIYTFLQGVTDDEAEEYFYDNREYISFWVFADYYRFSSCAACIPDSIIEDAINGYKEFLKQDFVQNLKKYSVDYIVWDRKNNPDWNFDRLDLEKKAEFEDFVIYNLNS